MTTPNDPQDPHNSQENQYPQYPATPHPEDRPGFGMQDPYQGYQQNQGNYGYQEYQGQGYGAGGPQWQAHVPVGTGKVHVMDAVKWGVGQVFRNPLVWVLGAFLFFTALIALTLVTELLFGQGLDSNVDPVDSMRGSLISQLIISALSLVLSVVIYHGALREIDQHKIGFGDFVNGVRWWPALAAFLIVGIISALATAVFLIPMMMRAISADVVAMTNESFETFLIGFMGLFFAMLIVSLLISPLINFIPWFAVDNLPVGQAIKAGFAGGLRNFGKLLAFYLCFGLVAVVAVIITLGFGLIIVLPAQLLITAMLYRQMAGRNLPATQPNYGQPGQ